MEPRYPSGETVWVRYVNSKGETICIITSKEARDWYYLYDLVDGKFVKRGKAKEPPELIARFDVNERIRSGLSKPTKK